MRVTIWSNINSYYHEIMNQKSIGKKYSPIAKIPGAIDEFLTTKTTASNEVQLKREYELTNNKRALI